MTAGSGPALQEFLSLRYSAGGHLATRFLFQPVGAVIAWASGRLGLSPSALTLAGTLVSMFGVLVWAAAPNGWSWVAASLLLLWFGYACDCADGQLARATGSSSAFGGWLDVYCDFQVIVMLAFACVWRLNDLGQGLTPLVMGAVTLFAGGRVGSLFSSTLARQRASMESSGTGRSVPQTLYTLLMDTPVTLAALCLFRDRPAALTALLVTSAILYWGHGVTLGLRRRSK